MSPTPLLKLAVQRLLLLSYHQGEQVSVQCTILVRTLQSRLCLRKWMRDKASEGWLHRCSHRREKQEKHLSIKWRKFCVKLISPSKRRGTCRDVLTQTEIDETQEAYRRHIPHGKEYGPNIKKFGITLKSRADEAAEGERAALSRLSEAEYHPKQDLRCTRRS